MLQYNTLNTLQYITLQYSTVLYNTYNSIQYSRQPPSLLPVSFILDTKNVTAAADEP